LIINKEKIMEELFAKIMDLIGDASAQAGVIAIAMEFVFRLVPTKKPLSILILIGDVAEMLGRALIALSKLMDRVLPQKTKEE
jgi:hypothetical protein